jgi:hypothetical protein
MESSKRLESGLPLQGGIAPSRCRRVSPFSPAFFAAGRFPLASATGEQHSNERHR